MDRIKASEGARTQTWRVSTSLIAALCAACASDAPPLEAQQLSLATPGARLGKQLFERPFPHTNGRACATCHVLDEATTLHPEHVEALLRDKPDDPMVAVRRG